MADFICDPEEEVFVAQDCGIDLAGIIGWGLIHYTEEPTKTELENPTFWEGKLGGSPQRYWNIPGTRGSYPGGTPTEGPGYGRKSVRRTGADHEVTLQVEGLDNRDFFDFVNNVENWHVVLITNGGRMLYERNVSVWVSLVLEEDIKAAAKWQASLKWSNRALPMIYAEPAGIFD